MNTTIRSSSEAAAKMIDHAGLGADQAIQSGQRAVHQAMDAVADGMDSTRNRVGAAVDDLAKGATDMAQRGGDMLRQRGQQLQRQAVDARDATVGYIQEEPLKAVLIAAGVGAGLVLLGSLLSRSSR